MLSIALHIVPVNKLVSLTWLLWALRSFRSFTLHYITWIFAREDKRLLLMNDPWMPPPIHEYFVCISLNIKRPIIIRSSISIPFTPYFVPILRSQFPFRAPLLTEFLDPPLDVTYCPNVIEARFTKVCDVRSECELPVQSYTKCFNSI